MAIGKSNWRYVVTDMAGGVHGEVQNAKTRTFNDPLNSMRQAGFTIDIDNPMAYYLTETDCLLKVYRQPKRGGSYQRLLVGDVVQAEERGDGNSEMVDVLAADPFWRVIKRIIPASLAVNDKNQGTGYTAGAPGGLLNLGQICKDMLATLGTTGITGGTVEGGIAASMVGPLYATFAGQMIQDACATLGGPDFYIDPNEPSGAMPDTVFGTINFVVKRGVTNANIVFEYGTGKRNVVSYSRLRTKQNSANNVIGLPQGWPTSITKGDHIVATSNSGAINARGQLDDLAGADVVSIDLRQKLCDEHVTVRKDRQQQITFVPKNNCPIEYGPDYMTGDIVTARAYARGTWRYNGTARIYGTAITIDENDNEVVALTLIPGG
jgi:hypothetical protein